MLPCHALYYCAGGPSVIDELGLKKWHGIQLDYMGIWNEKGPNLDWIVQLRRALDAEPTGVGRQVEIVAADGRWEICAMLKANTTVAAAVAKIGVHYPITDGLCRCLRQAGPHVKHVECSGLIVRVRVQLISHL